MANSCKLSDGMVAQTCQGCHLNPLMWFKCVHESWRDLVDSRFVASQLSNSNNSSSSTRIAVRRVVGGEEDDKEDVLGGEEAEEELDQWAEEMGESQAKGLGVRRKRKRYSGHAMIKANGVHSAICCIAIVFTKCDKRKRSRQGQWSNGNFTRFALLTIHFGHCQARGKIQTMSHEVYNVLSELCNRKQPEEKVPYCSF